MCIRDSLHRNHEQFQQAYLTVEYLHTRHMHGVIAVSYTHLDVYKRQVRGNDPEGYPFTGTIERLEIYAGALPDDPVRQLPQNFLPVQLIHGGNGENGLVNIHGPHPG